MSHAVSHLSQFSQQSLWTAALSINFVMEPFWKTKRFDELTAQEWESLCDGCGRCCVHKLEDEDSGRIHYTNVACRYLDQQSCRCRTYGDRAKRVPGCLTLKPHHPEQYEWLPQTCAYRVLAQGGTLAWWHPLVSGDSGTVHQAGISVRGKVVSETYIHDDQLEEHVIDWWH